MTDQCDLPAGIRTWTVDEAARYQARYDAALAAGTLRPGRLHFEDGAAVRAALGRTGLSGSINFHGDSGEMTVHAELRDPKSGNVVMVQVQEPTAAAVRAAAAAAKKEMKSRQAATKARRAAERSLDRE